MKFNLENLKDRVEGRQHGSVKGWLEGLEKELREYLNYHQHNIHCNCNKKLKEILDE